MDLDDAYANTAHIPQAESYPPRWATAASEFRASLGSRAQMGLPYGTAADGYFCTWGILARV